MDKDKQDQKAQKYRLVVQGPPDPELVTESLFGMSVSELAADIRKNKDGKWDRFWGDKGKSK